MNKNKRVVVGMSGGVDSSVTALLLKQQGYDVVGLFMRNWEYGIKGSQCPNRIEFEDAKKVGALIGIEVIGKDFVKEYRDRVFDVFLEGLKQGLTPNPDILCNKEIKFKAFLDYALTLGADYIATGHYTRRSVNYENNNGETVAQLLCGLDNNKDQSYFLHAVGGDKIAKTLFPVGELEKPVVRQIAEEHDLATAKKKDSTGICFIGERRFKDFLQQYLPAQKGDIVTDDGHVIGQHDGLMYYTLGQRGGIGIGGVKDRPEEPWFVLAKDLAKNRLIVGQGHEHPMLMSNELQAYKLDWVEGLPPANIFSTEGLRCMAKSRYRQPDQACRVYALNDNGSEVRVVFDEPQRAVTPGQSAVFYIDEVCLGGGVIATIDAPCGF